MLIIVSPIVPTAVLRCSSLVCIAAKAVLNGPADSVVIATNGFGCGNNGTCGGEVSGVVRLGGDAIVCVIIGVPFEMVTVW